MNSKLPEKPKAGRPSGTRNKKTYVAILDALARNQFNPINKLIKTYPELAPYEKAQVCMGLLRLALQQQQGAKSGKSVKNNINLNLGKNNPTEKNIPPVRIEELLSIAASNSEEETNES